jgi:AraC-like DNA-binding protein
MEVDPISQLAEWSTDSVPQRGAFDAWSDKMPELHLDWALTCPSREEFSAHIRYRRLSDTVLAEFRGGEFRGSRTRRSEPSGDERMIGILLNLSGRLVCHYAGDGLVLEANQMLVWDSELAYGFEGVEPHHELSLMLPRDRAPEALASIAAQTNTVTSVARGSGLVAVAAEQLKATSRELDGISDGGLHIAVQAFLDILDAGLANPADHAMTSPRAALLAQVRRYIEDNLDDPGLCASSIASAHSISVRTLHLLFADTGTTVSRSIRQRRLDICYRELSRARSGKTVTDVAFRWGFTDTAHFSRLFKQAYGVTPSSVNSRPQSEAS